MKVQNFLFPESWLTMSFTQYNEAPQITVTQNGVYKLLHGLNQHKATGPDEISTKFLKENVSYGSHVGSQLGYFDLQKTS
jgi:hypothetical protein